MTKLTPIPCLFALAAVLGCGETQEQETDQLTFDRPVDIAFACYGQLRITEGESAGPVPVTSAMPTSACDLRSGQPTSSEPPTPPGQEGVSPVSWYGLILQSGPGTVGIAKFETKPGDTLGSEPGDVTVEDANQFTPGKNGISVGEEPVAIHTDPAGCHAITANAGSCDLSVVDLNSAFDNLGIEGLKSDSAPVRVDRLAVKNASGVPIRARPAAMVGEPSSDLIGATCPAGPKGIVYLAYPSCHLVAAVDTATGTIVSGIQYGPGGVPTIVDGNVTCPAECGGGGTVTPGVRPVTLDLRVAPDLQLDPSSFTRRLAIGADNSAQVTVVDLDATWRPSALMQIPLEDTKGTLGITSIALSPQIGMGGGASVFDDETGNLFQFVYATATDGTVRVADVLNQRRECDTQVDARFAREIRIVSDLSCLPIGTISTPRRAGARSPGIHLPGDPIPLSVNIFRSREPLGSRSPEAQTTLIGYFAVITASNGSVFVVNVDDDNFADVFSPSAPLAAQVQLVMAHQLRDAIGNRYKTIDDEDALYTETKDPQTGMVVNTEGDDDDKDCDYTGGVGGPRAAATPARTVPTGSVATEKLTQLPGFRQILCDRSARRNPSTDPAASGRPEPEDLKAISELMFAAPKEVRDRVFPDLEALPDAETWTMVWEGSLSLNSGTTDIDGPAIRESRLRVDALRLYVLDATRPFCEAGVEPFDILQLRGCDPSIGGADCPSGYTCFVHPDSQVQGLGACMLPDEADLLAGTCKDYLTSLRRYTIAAASSGELIALPRRVELRTTPLDGCVDDAQCESLADYAARSASGSHPVDDMTAADPRTWSCVADPLRAPKAGTGKRCELRCSKTEDCRQAGAICQAGFCMEGVLPPQECINASQRYELRAGEAFAVIGSQTGFVHPIIENAAGQCVRDPMASPLSVGRLPLMPHDPLAPSTVHMCDPTADPITGKTAGGTLEPNPCFTTVPHTEVLPDYEPGTCTLKRDENGDPLGVILDPPRDAPAVRFRNRQMTLTIVDPYYPGDAMCITDRAKNLVMIPHVVPGLSLSFRQTAGFVPQQLFTDVGASGTPSFPVKVVRGPTDSIWVVDEGDFLSSSIQTPSTRGKVLRVHPAAPSTTSVLR